MATNLLIRPKLNADERRNLIEASKGKSLQKGKPPNFSEATNPVQFVGFFPKNELKPKKYISHWEKERRKDVNFKKESKYGYFGSRDKGKHETLREEQGTQHEKFGLDDGETLN